MPSTEGPALCLTAGFRPVPRFLGRSSSAEGRGWCGEANSENMATAVSLVFLGSEGQETGQEKDDLFLRQKSRTATTTTTTLTTTVTTAIATTAHTYMRSAAYRRYGSGKKYPAISCYPSSVLACPDVSRQAVLFSVPEPQFFLWNRYRVYCCRAWDPPGPFPN